MCVDTYLLVRTELETIHLPLEYVNIKRMKLFTNNNDFLCKHNYLFTFMSHNKHLITTELCVNLKTLILSL